MFEALHTIVKDGKKYEIFADIDIENPIDMAGYGRVMGAFTGAGTFGEDLKKELEDWQEDRARLLDDLEECHDDYMQAQNEWFRAYFKESTEERELWEAATLKRDWLGNALADLEEHDNNRPNLVVLTEQGHKYFAGCELFVDIDGMLEETGLTLDDIEQQAQNMLELMCQWLQGDVYRVEVSEWSGDTDFDKWLEDGQPSDVEDWTELDSLGGIYGLNYLNEEEVIDIMK